ncbi:PREDICTED: uncharacterized protein LOC105556660 [Vollenhovia emeryi]|uniref:uncharacterized protein LOC105556660 n=1 Tax=Vollenhovia emeryi TaxID=411798 RepID=UPI0005F3F5BF|nr:PREDICTED: uncharacterized protein LOC105556660 [Vollenhovia emeryi]
MSRPPRPNLKGYGLLQANVNHSPHAQDLLQQSMVERGFTLAIVAEPHRPPRSSPYWAVGQAGDSVAIRWRSVPGGPSTTPIESGERHIAVQWGPIVVVGVYLRPTRRLAPFKGWLSDLGQTVLTPLSCRRIDQFAFWTRSVSCSSVCS